MVHELLKERTQVWAMYCLIGSMQPFNRDQPLELKIQEFCQLMIDYISLGHFGIYQRIIDGRERRRKVIEVAEIIYPRIAEATSVAVDFNDKYEYLSGEPLRLNLAVDLSLLGEELARRIELEDQLISTMMS
jgi:regulator of sigma D